MNKKFIIEYTDNGETFVTPGMSTFVVQKFLEADEIGEIEIVSIKGVK